MENEVNYSDSMEKNQMIIDENCKINLTKIRKWTMFFTVMGFILIGFMALGALVMGVIALVGGTFGGFHEASFLGIFTVLYLVIGLVYFFPVYYLLKFSVHMKSAIEKTSQTDLVTAFQNMGSHFKFVGIFTIVLISLYILIFIVAIVAGVAGMAGLF